MAIALDQRDGKSRGITDNTLTQNCFVVLCWCGSGGIAIANNIS